MQKLQQIIDATFKPAERAPEHPSEAFIERERLLNEQAKKVETLRQVRLRSDSSMRRVPSLVFEVVRHRGFWRTLYRHRHSAPFPDQAAAIHAAKDLARKKRDLGHAVEVRLVRNDGQVVRQTLDEERDG